MANMIDKLKNPEINTNSYYRNRIIETANYLQSFLVLQIAIYENCQYVYAQLVKYIKIITKLYEQTSELEVDNIWKSKKNQNLYV